MVDGVIITIVSVASSFECTRMLQSFLKDKVGLHLVDMTAKVPLTMDTVNFTTYEIRTDPSSKWYDPKSHSSGLVSVFVFLIVVAFVFQTFHLNLNSL